jgi:hypothetical protein
LGKCNALAIPAKSLSAWYCNLSRADRSYFW